MRISRTSLVAATRQAAIGILASSLAVATAKAQSTFTLFISGAVSVGLGTARITSSPAGIDCIREPNVLPSSGTCQAAFAAGTVVTLTATVLNEGTFENWTGACSGTGICQVTMDANRSVSANITPKLYTLTVTALPGTNSNSSVRALDELGRPPISCGLRADGSTTGTCTSQYPANKGARLDASVNVASSARFAGWSGTCPGFCVMDSDKTATTGFIAMEVIVQSGGGTGTGLVTGPVGNSPSFDCTIAPGTGATGVCSAKWETSARPATVTLTATPTGNSVFAGWSGQCAGTATTCVIPSQTEVMVVSARFDLPSFQLSTSLNGTGTGTVVSNPSGINCQKPNAGNTSCNGSFAGGASVTLTASPTGGSTFAGWTSGACTGTAPSCIITVSGATTASAQFTAPRPAADLARALLGEITLSANEQLELDKFGNNNGGFDLGDLLALMNRRGERLSPATLGALMSRVAPNDLTRPNARRIP
jgi:hypothetical protein